MKGHWVYRTSLVIQFFINWLSVVHFVSDIYIPQLISSWQNGMKQIFIAKWTIGRNNLAWSVHTKILKVINKKYKNTSFISNSQEFTLHKMGSSDICISWTFSFPCWFPGRLFCCCLFTGTCFFFFFFFFLLFWFRFCIFFIFRLFCFFIIIFIFCRLYS